MHHPIHSKSTHVVGWAWVPVNLPVVSHRKSFSVERQPSWRSISGIDIDRMQLVATETVICSIAMMNDNLQASQGSDGGEAAVKSVANRLPGPKTCLSRGLGLPLRRIVSRVPSRKRATLLRATSRSIGNLPTKLGARATSGCKHPFEVEISKDRPWDKRRQSPPVLFNTKHGTSVI